MEILKSLDSNPDFTLQLQTAEFDFFCNADESDENGYVKMFDKSGKLISDNYFGYHEVYEILTERRNEIIFASEDMLYNINQIVLQENEQNK